MKIQSLTLKQWSLDGKGPYVDPADYFSQV